jgi:hypothetical protein
VASQKNALITGIVASKARERLSWSARDTFSELVREMVYSDLYSLNAGGEISAAPTALSPHAETQRTMQQNMQLTTGK